MFAGMIGPILTILGATLAALIPGIASARAVGRLGEAGAGVLTEDPSKFGKVLILQALPGTQGIYGLLSWFIIMTKSTLLSGGGAANLTWDIGLRFFLSAIPIIVVGHFSAVYQGRVSESSVAMVAKRPEAAGKGIVMSIMVETYAILALLATIMGVFSVEVR